MSAVSSKLCRFPLSQPQTPINSIHSAHRSHATYFRQKSSSRALPGYVLCIFYLSPEQGGTVKSTSPCPCNQRMPGKSPGTPGLTFEKWEGMQVVPVTRNVDATTRKAKAPPKARRRTCTFSNCTNSAKLSARGLTRHRSPRQSPTNPTPSRLIMETAPTNRMTAPIQPADRPFTDRSSTDRTITGRVLTDRPLAIP